MKSAARTGFTDTKDRGLASRVVGVDDEGVVLDEAGAGWSRRSDAVARPRHGLGKRSAVTPLSILPVQKADHFLLEHTRPSYIYPPSAPSFPTPLPLVLSKFLFWLGNHVFERDLRAERRAYNECPAVCGRGHRLCVVELVRAAVGGVVSVDW